MKPPLFCIFDDRAQTEPGIRLLVGSLKKASPQARICVFFDPATPALSQWLGGMDGVELRPAPFPTGLGYDTKPHALIALLEAGEDQVVWLDSDLIVARDPEPLFRDVPEDTLCITQDALWGRYDDGHGARAQAWDQAVTRAFGHCLNTCVVRATRAHLPLLRDWLEWLNAPHYRQAQQSHWASRPDHLAGDQDVMTALLSSTHGDVPVRILARSRDIIQAFGLKGYTLAERLQNLREGPSVFIHAQGYKPWQDNREGWVSQVYFDSSPYILAALRHQEALAGKTDILAPRTRMGAVLRRAGFGSIPLTGLPMAAAFDLAFALRHRIKRLTGRAPKA